MGRSMNADTLSRLTAAWVRPSSEIFYKRGALMCKPIGDAIMAVWTHTTPTADPHRLREILHAIADLPRVFHHVTAEFQLPAPLRFGAGVSTGEVSLTTLGSGRADVLGDTVNLAFRLETASKATGADILLCDASLQALRQQWPMSEFEPHTVALKGYPEPVTAWGSRLP
jgi:adenylate cyclase